MRRNTLGVLAAVVPLATLLLGAPPARAEDAADAPTKAAAAQAAAPSESQAKARQLLDGMARFLAGQKEFRVDLLTGYEVMQESGQKIEFGSRRTVRLRRPGHLRLDTVAGDGTKDAVVFDGKTMIAYDAGANVYASAEQSAGLDETIVHYVRDLGMRLPLAPLLVSTFPAELERRVETVDYVETTDVFGSTCHHIAGRTATVDFEAWIEDGKEPLLRRIALTYREEQGHPRFWADFSDWDLDPDFRDSAFEFSAPDGAKSIAFAAKVVQRVATSAPAAKPAQGESR